VEQFFPIVCIYFLTTIMCIRKTVFAIVCFSINSHQAIKIDLSTFTMKISPQCWIKVIFDSSTGTFSRVPYGIFPIVIIPIYENFHSFNLGNKNDTLKHYSRLKGVNLALLKSECIFNILLLQDFPLKPNPGEINWYSKWLNLIVASIMSANDRGPDVRPYCVISFNVRPNEFILRKSKISKLIQRYILIYRNESIKQNEVLCGNYNQIRICNHANVSNVVNLIDSCVIQNENICVRYQLLKCLQDLETQKGFRIKTAREILRIANASVAKKKKKSTSHYFIAVSLQKTRGDNILVLLYKREVRMFTCYSPPFVSFHMYISSFDSIIWILLICTGLTLTGFLSLHIRYNTREIKSLAPLLFCFSVFTEESFSIPRKLAQDRVYRISTVSFVLFSVIVTNTYLCKVIAELNSPLKGTMLRNIREMQENLIYLFIYLFIQEVPLCKGKLHLRK